MITMSRPGTSYIVDEKDKEKIDEYLKKGFVIEKKEEEKKKPKKAVE
jgi:hypothetical protein